jgi:hypothetical protein
MAYCHTRRVTLTQRIINLAFFASHKVPDGSLSEQRQATPDSLARLFPGEHRPTLDYTQTGLTAAKGGRCFVAGLCNARGSVISRSALVLDGDTTEDAKALLDATSGYCRLVWETYKSGLREPEDKTQPWTPDDTCIRVRIVLPLDEDVPADQWSPEAVQAAFPASDRQTYQLAGLAFTPASWDPSRLEVASEDGPFYPASRIKGVPNKAPRAKLTDWQDPATETATPDDLSRLRARLKKRAGEENLTMARYVYSLMIGKSIARSGARNAASLAVCNCLSAELSYCTIDSILDLCDASLADMQADGSNETREGWHRMMRTWRERIAADKASVDFEMPWEKPDILPGTTDQGEPIDLPVDLEASEYPQDVLDARFFRLRSPSGDYRYFSRDKDGVCAEQLADGNMLEALSYYSSYVDSKGETRKPDHKNAMRLLNNWKTTGRVETEEPAPARFKSDPGLCYQRLPYDPSPGETPAWDEFCSRLSNADLFRAFIWTAFEPRNQGRQIVWLVGNGQDGKSTVINVIFSALGSAASSVNLEIFKSKHGTSMLVGKRMVYVPDCKDTKLLMNDRVREATSGDISVIEPKGRTPYSKALNLKMIVLSNFFPAVTSQRADISRLLPINVAPTTSTNDPSWATRLKAELPHFLWACREAYTRLCPNHGNLPIDQATLDMVEDFADSYEEEFQLVVADRLAVTGVYTDRVNRSELHKKLMDPSLGLGWSNGKVRAFRSFLKNKYNIGTVKVQGHYFYTGLKMSLPGTKASMSLIPGGAK